VRSFVDRDEEQAALRDRLERAASFSLIYGQRRTGKTYLLQHVSSDRGDVLYFLADESTAPAQLDRFRGLVHQTGLGGPAWDAASPADWPAALTLFSELATRGDRSVVLVLDEIQYILDASPEVPSVLQRIWDQVSRDRRLHIILCGSALGTLSKLGDVGQPLHGRFDLRLKLQPFRAREAALFAPRWRRADRLRLYGVFGGLARHLAEVDARASLADNAIRSILAPLGALHEAPLDLLRTEHVSAHAEANAVLSAIASGEDRFNAIASRTGLTGARLDYVLKELLRLEIVRREARFGDRPSSKYARYRCADPFTVFWFRYVRPNQSALMGTPPAQIWRDRIAPRLDEHMGWVFETVVRQFIEAGGLHAQLGSLDEIGPYWSRDGQTEIDLLARFDQRVVAVECKWRPDATVALGDLRRLREHVARLPRSVSADPPHLALASLGRFTPTLRAAAKEEGVTLIGGTDLLGT
jgi:hypothetical protein